MSETDLSTNSNGLTHFVDATIEDLLANPAKYGAPTFEEFSKNRDKYLGTKDEIAGVIDKGSRNLREVRRHVYYLEGYRCDSLETVERLANNMGLDWRGMDFRPEVRQDVSGKYYIEVRFKRKPSGGAVTDAALASQ